jgi:hypothetical protein
MLKHVYIVWKQIPKKKLQLINNIHVIWRHSSEFATINSAIDTVKFSKYNSYLLNKIKGDEVIKKLRSLLTKST